MTQQDTKREQEIQALFEKAGQAARDALNSARDACSRQAQIIIDLQKNMAGAKANSVDDETLSSWTDQVNEAVENAGKIQQGFDQIGVPGTEPPPTIPGYNPPTGRPHPSHPIANVPEATPYDKGKGR